MKFLFQKLVKKVTRESRAGRADKEDPVFSA